MPLPHVPYVSTFLALGHVAHYQAMVFYKQVGPLNRIAIGNSIGSGFYRSNMAGRSCIYLFPSPLVNSQGFKLSFGVPIDPEPLWFGRCHKTCKDGSNQTASEPAKHSKVSWHQECAFLPSELNN